MTPTPATSGAPRCFALVPCAGVGARSGADRPKQYVALAGRPMVAHTLDALAAVARIEATLLVIAADDTLFDRLLPGWALEAPGRWLARCGGATRAATVASGLAELAARGARDDDWVLVHDAARCLLQPEWVERLIDACIDDPVGGLLALPMADTMKQAGADGRVAATVERSGKWAAQTPQMFRVGALRRALAEAGDGVTDEASALEAVGQAPKLVVGDVLNVKVTWPGDFTLAARLLQRGPLSSPRQATMTAFPALRIGEGWDTHQLVAGRPLILGGVTIPHSHGLLGHSDADALLHAITDALLGGAGLGDIGRHFPDTDPAFKGADSVALLAEAVRRVHKAGWQPLNVDATIVAQAPKMAPHIEAMRSSIAATLGLDAAAVNVKAKTAERLGPVGEGRSIEARAVVLLAGRAPIGRAALP